MNTYLAVFPINKKFKKLITKFLFNPAFSGLKGSLGRTGTKQNRIFRTSRR